MEVENPVKGKGVWKENWKELGFRTGSLSKRTREPRLGKEYPMSYSREHASRIGAHHGAATGKSYGSC